MPKEGQHVLTMEVEGVDAIVDGLVRAAEAQPVRGDHTNTCAGKDRDHLSINVAPTRLAMQTEKHLV